MFIEEEITINIVQSGIKQYNSHGSYSIIEHS